MIQSLKKSTDLVVRVTGKVKLPEKFKGTILEKWTVYWKNLFIDYRQMLQDFRTDIQDEPYKALMWTAVLGGSFFLAKNNPDELDYKHCLKEMENKIAMVSEECLNKKSLEHLRFVEMSYNEGLIHYRSLGIFSILYTSNVNTSCDLYKAQCTYIQPSYASFPSRIVDIGILGRWWNLYRRTVDYDVNFE